MNSPVNPVLLLCVVITAALLVVWLHARRRRARDIVERMHDQLAVPAVRNREHVLHPPPIAPFEPHLVTTIGATGAVGDDGTVELGQQSAEGAVATAVIAPPAAEDSQTLTDMLQGIELPYDLMPVTSVVEDPDRHIIFLTTHSNAGEVGKRFADELERLGFELDTVDFDQAIAVRGDDVVSMKIVPNADQVEHGGSPRYGAAGSGDVALETWIGRSPVPPSAAG